MTSSWASWSNRQDRTGVEAGGGKRIIEAGGGKRKEGARRDEATTRIAPEEAISQYEEERGALVELLVHEDPQRLAEGGAAHL